MNNKGIIIAIVVIVLIVGGWLLMRGGSDAPADSGSDTNVESDVPSSFTGSMRDLIARKAPMHCTFTRTDEMGTVSGEVYVDGERYRGMFTMQTAEMGEMKTDTLQDGEHAYTWGESPMGTMATKWKITDAGDVEADDSGSHQPFDEDEALEHDCDAWRVDESMLKPPSDIEFQDLTASMMQINEATGDVQQAQCDACMQVPEGQGRDQCLEALGC